jgi:hypothetical protein
MMLHHHPTARPLPTPTLTAEVTAAIACYEPRLLSPSQSESGLEQMRALIAACAPPSATDAITMLSTLSRFIADVADDEVDLTRLLLVWRVARMTRKPETPSKRRAADAPIRMTPRTNVPMQRAGNRERHQVTGVRA